MSLLQISVCSKRLVHKCSTGSFWESADLMKVLDLRRRGECSRMSICSGNIGWLYCSLCSIVIVCDNLLRYGGAMLERVGNQIIWLDLKVPYIV